MKYLLATITNTSSSLYLIIKLFSVTEFKNFVEARLFNESFIKVRSEIEEQGFFRVHLVSDLSVIAVFVFVPFSDNEDGLAISDGSIQVWSAPSVVGVSCQVQTLDLHLKLEVRLFNLGVSYAHVETFLDQVVC
jgi:hypothetical protein